MTRVRHAARRAFATIAALGLVAVIGVTLAALATLIAGDVKRTVGSAADAQLRQLLIAGEAAARASLTGDVQSGEVPLELPGELKSAGTTLTIKRLQDDAAGEARLEITARDADGRTVTQTVRYARAADGWQLRAAEL